MENLKIVGITFSVFDLFHAGHVRMLADAKKRCNHLIVGLQTDPTIDRPEKNRPTQTVVEGYVQLKACKYVDEIIPYTTEQDLEDILKLYDVDLQIIGDEYREKNYTGRSYCEEKGITIYYNERNHRFSSSGLRQEVYKMEAVKSIAKLNDTEKNKSDNSLKN